MVEFVDGEAANLERQDELAWEIRRTDGTGGDKAMKGGRFPGTGNASWIRIGIAGARRAGAPGGPAERQFRSTF